MTTRETGNVPSLYKWEAHSGRGLRCPPSGVARFVKRKSKGVLLNLADISVRSISPRAQCSQNVKRHRAHVRASKNGVRHRLEPIADAVSAEQRQKLVKAH